mgnify:CR=1 FL=1
MITENPYLVLNVPENSHDENIRLAYQKKVKEFPPEKNAQEFQRITEAYELIRDEVKRARLRLFFRDIDSSEPFIALIPQSSQRRRLPFSNWLQDIRTLNNE